MVTGRESRGSQVRRSELRSRFQLSGSWGSTPARSCSQRWGSLAAGRTRRSGGVGGVQAGPWGRLERGCVLGGRSSGVYSRRLGKGSLAGKVRGSLTLRMGFPGYRSPHLRPHPSVPSPGLTPPGLILPLTRHPTRSRLTCSTQSRLRLAPPLHRNVPPLEERREVPGEKTGRRGRRLCDVTRGAVPGEKAAAPLTSGSVAGRR